MTTQKTLIEAPKQNRPLIYTFANYRAARFVEQSANALGFRVFAPMGYFAHTLQCEKAVQS